MASGTLERCYLHGWIPDFTVQGRLQTACMASCGWAVCWCQCCEDCQDPETELQHGGQDHIQRFNRTGSTQNRPRHGRPKKLSARAQRKIQRLCLGNRRMSAASIAAEVEGVGSQPVSAQTISHTQHQIGLHGCHPRKKPLLKMMHKKARKQFAEDKQTKDMGYWNYVLWSDETKINLFGSDGVKRVWRQPGEEHKDKCVLSSMVVGVSWTGAAWVLPALGSYSLLREPWMPTCTVTYWSRAWSPPFGDWAARQYSNMKMTTALLKKLRVKVIDWPCMFPDLNLIEYLWGILKWKVEECKVSNIHQFRDVVMEEWKRTPVATCAALMNSMPKRVKVVLENNGGHTKYWHFGPIWTFSLRGVLTFVASGLDVHLKGQQIYTVIQAVHSLLYIVAKCNFFSVVTWKYIINIYKNVRGVLTSVRYYI